MTVKRWIALGIAALVLVISGAFQLAMTVASASFSDMIDLDGGDFRQEIMEVGSNGQIAVIDLNGMIMDTGADDGLFASGGYNHRTFLQKLETAMEDTMVDGIVINVDTPGGGVVESASIHERVVRAQEEYDTPVYISMGGMAASGGYYISAPADYIAAHPATMTGSLGVIMDSINFSELAEEWGISHEVIKSGDYKDMGSPTREMTDDEEAILQSMVDDMYEDFVEVIVDGRDMPESEVLELAQGQIFTGNQALENGLIDGLGDLEHTIEHMEEQLELDATVIHYTNSFGTGSIWGLMAEAVSGDNLTLSHLEELVTHSSAPRLMYLYQE
ncbi:signal peptide peptidase SppA [Geomicrobium sp. JSM 1781026]|uniref:signal peptide peptidase SppA n=1 Tax=unclassified Geomicrobium TaxID=2628951 RepID=UPI00045F4135|nr:signal peptide peptidase SppA [Geomicrobium sp. JCM 19039]GAK12938.1 protease IV [Geomicrobium sp. JCM 19039]